VAPSRAASPAGGVSGRVKVAFAGVLTLLVLGGAGVAVAIKLHHDSMLAAAHRRAAAAAQAQKDQQQALAQQRQQQRQQEVAQRQSLEQQLQSAITQDASTKANEGLLIDGPAESTSCTPVSGGSSQNLGQSTGTYSCIAVYQTNGDGTQSGYDYTGTINFATGDFTWQLGGNGVGG
jgi:hypothetical protein